MPVEATRTTTYFVTQTIYVPVLLQVNIPLDGSQPQNNAHDPFSQFLNNIFLHSQNNPKPPPQISKEFFNSLSTLEVQDRNELNKMDPCAICLDEFKVGEKAVQLPCSHIFHEEDIKEWLRNSPTCPNCRLELPLEDPEQEKARRKRMEEKGVKQQQQQQHTIPPSYSDTSTQTEDMTTTTTTTTLESTTTQNTNENITFLHNNNNNNNNNVINTPQPNTNNINTQTQTDLSTPPSETIQESTPPSPSLFTSFGIERGFLLRDKKNKKNSTKSSTEEDSFLSGFKRGFLQNNNKKQKKN